MPKNYSKTVPSINQSVLFLPETNWKPPIISELPSWAGAKRVAFDTETSDPTLREMGIGVRRKGKMVGFSFAIEDGPKHYVPFRHAGGDNVAESEALRYLRDNAKNFSGILVGANLSYDLDYAMEEGANFENVKFFRDIQIADPLIYELHMHYSLQAIAERHGCTGKEEKVLREAAAIYGVDAKKGMWQLPARFVGAYAEEDAAEPLRIIRKQERLIDEKDLWNIYNLESKVLPVLVKMRRRGIKINTDKLEQIKRWSIKEESEALKQIWVETGVKIDVGNVWKPDAIAPCLEAIGVVLEETSTGKPSIDKDLLGSIDHPVAQALSWARRTNKLRTTFAASVERYMTNDRIHCTFNQIAREDDSGDQKGARYGRLSCVHPNLQQQPARDEFAKMWREIYEPDDGGLWCSNDFSQQEPRWTTHFAALTKLPKAELAAKAYHDDPKLDNHQFMADLTGLPRKQAKNLYLGLCYGEGGAKLCRELGLPTRWMVSHGTYRERRVEYFENQESAMEAKAKIGKAFCYEVAGEKGQSIIDQFDDRAPFIRKLAKDAEEKAKNRGYIRTGGGRRLHFEQDASGNYKFTHKALNRLIQGTSADQTKMALVALEEAGHFIQLQVHDEICATVADETEGRKIAEVMSTIMPALVPFRVDTEIGTSWGNSM